jgi:hypothetical protein
MLKYLIQITLRLLGFLVSRQAAQPVPESYVPVQLSAETGLTLETVTSGFLSHPVIYYVWKENKPIAWSTDKINWRMLSWVDRIPRPTQTPSSTKTTVVTKPK